MIRGLIIIVVIAAAICVPIVVLNHKSLMPTHDELAQLDSLVRKAFPASSAVRRLSAPDRLEMSGNVETGYFTYLISTPAGDHKVQVDWRIEAGKVELLKIRD